MDINSSMTVQLVLMEAIRRVSTHPVVSVLLCSLMPQFSQKLPSVMARFATWVLLKLQWRSKYYHRCIEFKAGASSSDGEEASTEKNNILHKAIRLYINKCMQGEPMNSATLYLMSSQSNGGKLNRPHTRNFGDIDAGLKMLQRYAIVRGPQEHIWQVIDPLRQIEFRHHSTEAPLALQKAGENQFDQFGRRVENSNTSKTSTTFEFRCNAANASTSVDDYIEEALEYYKGLKASCTDKTRYFFMPVITSSGFNGSGKGYYDDDDCFGKGCGKGGSGSRSYKKFELSEHKTFDSLYFPDKTHVLRILDDFAHMRGKFAIAGYPNKLGLLLHGPPGTGKTSLIKSIAQYTKRHIVEVPLAKVSTNQQLFDSIFDLRLNVPGDDDVLKPTFKDVIFVLEDVDAVSDVVYKRTPEPRKDDHCPDYKLSRDGKGKGKGKLGREGCKGKGPPDGDVKHDSDNTSHDAASDTSLLSNVESHGRASLNADDESAREVSNGIAKLVGAFEELGKGKSKKGSDVADNKYAGPDALNLAGLLNVLDGVVDTPGRIVIMTTNHPEKLDAALIRPGRINLTVELTYMTNPAITHFIQHLMQQELSTEQIKLLDEISESCCLTPAQVEQMCAEADTVDQLMSTLMMLSESGRSK